MRFSLLLSLALSVTARGERNQFAPIPESYSISAEEAFSWIPSTGTVVNAINVIGDTNTLENISLPLDEAQCVAHSPTVKDPSTGQPLCIAYKNSGNGTFGGSEANGLVVGNVYHFQLIWSKAVGSKIETSNSAQFKLVDGSPQSSTSTSPSSTPPASPQASNPPAFSTSPDSPSATVSPTSFDSSVSSVTSTFSESGPFSKASGTIAQSTTSSNPSSTAVSVTTAKSTGMPVKMVVGITVASGATAIALIGLLFFGIRARQRAAQNKNGLGANNFEDSPGGGLVSPQPSRGLLSDDFYMRENNIPPKTEYISSTVDTPRYVAYSPPPQEVHIQPITPIYDRSPYPSNEGGLAGNLDGRSGLRLSPPTVSRRSSVSALSIIDENEMLPDLDDPRNMSPQELMRLQDEERRIDEAIAAQERRDGQRGWR